MKQNGGSDFIVPKKKKKRIKKLEKLLCELLPRRDNSYYIADPHDAHFPCCSRLWEVLSGKGDTFHLRSVSAVVPRQNPARLEFLRLYD